MIPRKLSGSTNGRPIPVAATSTPGTTIHTATAASGELDVVTIYAANTSSSSVKLTLELGGTSSPGDLIEVTIPGEDGLYPIVDALPLDGGVVVRAFAATGSVINVVGRVQRWAGLS